jgi:hypothetical protein
MIKILLFSIVILSGCASNGPPTIYYSDFNNLPAGYVEYGRDYERSRLSHLRLGMTTVEQSIGWIGEPHNITISSDGEKTLNWAYYNSFIGGKQSIGVFGVDGKLKSLRSIESPPMENMVRWPPVGPDPAGRIYQTDVLGNIQYHEPSATVIPKSK